MAFNSSLSGMRAANADLNVTSHNIANVGTAGYSRQSITQSTNPAQFTGGGFHFLCIAGGSRLFEYAIDRRSLG